MDRLCFRILRDAENRIDVQIALDGQGAANLAALIHRAAMERLPVRLGVHANAPDLHGAGGPCDPNRDLAAVRDQQPPEHVPPRHSGMLPCFFGGRASRFVRSTVKALITRGRVCGGSITSSR